MFNPAIKWSGVKGKQSSNIVKLFPKEIKIYYEPFLGSGAMAYKLMETNHFIKKYILSDLNNDLISTWIIIKNDYLSILHSYKELYGKYMSLDWGDRKFFYKEIRSRFNKYKSPHDFFFIMRTAVNGMPRYNKKGEFNTSNQLKQNPINPNRLEKVLFDWSILLNKNDTEFLNANYQELKSEKGDVLYLDPPYSGSKNMYYGTISYEMLWDWIRNQYGKVFMSFDGYINLKDEIIVPKNLFNKRIEIENGNSSFRRQKLSENGIVKEYLFYNE